MGQIAAFCQYTHGRLCGKHAPFPHNYAGCLLSCIDAVLPSPAYTGHTAAMETTKEAFGRLYGIIQTLRGPEGCPWDREQTPASIRGNLIEEAYECVEAINEGDTAHVQEEIGDVFLLATFLGIMYEGDGSFTVAQSLDTVCDKLVRRHPHVFADASADNPEQVVKQWNDIKETVEGRRKKDSALDAVSRALPPLERAYKLQKAAAKTGFDWPDHQGAWEKLAEEVQEAREAADSSKLDHERLEEEIGDLLFSAVNVARKHKVDPALALHRSLEKFSARFRHVEKRMAEHGEAMESASLERMDGFWDEAKAQGL